ncbi:hypothetical protein Tco_0271722 [Tanacetum coccineum]
MGMNFLHSTFALLLNILSGTPYLEGTLGWEGNDSLRRKPDVFGHGLGCSVWVPSVPLGDSALLLLSVSLRWVASSGAITNASSTVCIFAFMGVMNGVWLVMLEIGFKGMISCVLPSIPIPPSLAFAPFDVMGIGGGGEGVFLEEEEGEECGFDSKEDDVVPKVDDVYLVDGFFDDSLGGGGDRDGDFAKGDGV